MAINTNSSVKASAPSSSSAAPSTSTNDLIELSILQKKAPGTAVAAAAAVTTTTTPILKRKGGGGSKRLQFSTPEFSVTPIATVPGINTRLIPSRRREEAIVMANLRKRVAACDLERRRPVSAVSDASRTSEPNQDELDNRPLLSKTFSNRDSCNDGSVSGAGDESPKSISSFVQDKDFILDCLCWHNEYRARHSAKALTVSPELCDAAQKWANHLAATNEFYYRSAKTLGQNLFCCPCSALVTDLTGQEVASYWYSTVRRYNYFKDIRLLHTNVNAGHFTQMVWLKTKLFGIGKATSQTGKIFVVAFYYPPGNIVNEFHLNVLPPTMDQASSSPKTDSSAQTSSKSTSRRPK
ncbi:protein PRY1-like isoform X2 [Contarinia nasturtii]|uniref:protein PRY1-like isoform X2 n=1 Tax=Contarinia nasturtii TaxID=265458 RepID=UPI0012D4503B|nr:protein PRY1-like isoform X2 [Contarinia nasturtii]